VTETLSKSKLAWLLQPWTMIIAGSAGFAAVALDVRFHGQLAKLDGIVAPFLHQHANATLMLLAAYISGLGEFIVILAFACAVGAVLILRKKWRLLTTWTIGLIGSGVLNQLFKNIFAVPRPTTNTVYTFPANAGFSFPSGHTMAVAVASGLFVLVLAELIPLSPRTRASLFMAAAALAMLEAAGLLYLGVHYLTDVLGALPLSLAWLGVLALFLQPATPRVYNATFPVEEAP
jgi:membrane-associated phospholipid phosphatase